MYLQDRSTENAAKSLILYPLGFKLDGFSNRHNSQTQCLNVMEIILATLLGITLGIVSGILPGIGSASIMLTFYMVLISFDPLSAMVCYLALVISSQYVASLTAIYTGIPGAESSFPTAKESGNLINLGLTQTAVAQNAIASVIGNGIGLTLLLLLIPLATKILGIFGAALQLGIIITSILIVVLTTERRMAALVSILLAFGFMFIGPNAHTFQTIDFGFEFLSAGLSWVALTMGAIVGSSMHSMREYTKVTIDTKNVMGFSLGLQSLKDKWGSLMRGSFVGFFVGLVPGLSYILSATVCYQIEQKISETKKLPLKDRVLSSIMSSDAAHCSGTLAMLLPLLAFGVPITASEGVIYNIITLSTTTKELLASIYDNWLAVGLIILFVNLISMFAAWKLGSKLVSVLMMPRVYLLSLILLISLGAVIYISSMTGTIWLSVATYALVGLLFYKTKMSPLPFIFGVLVFNLLESLVVSVTQLYF